MPVSRVVRIPLQLICVPVSHDCQLTPYQYIIAIHLLEPGDFPALRSQVPPGCPWGVGPSGPSNGWASTLLGTVRMALPPMGMTSQPE